MMAQRGVWGCSLWMFIARGYGLGKWGLRLHCSPLVLYAFCRQVRCLCSQRALGSDGMSGLCVSIVQPIVSNGGWSSHLLREGKRGRKDEVLGLVRNPTSGWRVGAQDTALPTMTWTSTNGRFLELLPLSWKLQGCPPRVTSLRV
jgi:hypothetical protein